MRSCLPSAPMQSRRIARAGFVAWLRDYDPAGTFRVKFRGSRAEVPITAWESLVGTPSVGGTPWLS